MKTTESIIKEFRERFTFGGKTGIVAFRNGANQNAYEVEQFIKEAVERVREEKHQHNFEIKYVHHPYLPKVEQYTICSKCGQQSGTQTYSIDKLKINKVLSTSPNNCQEELSSKAEEKEENYPNCGISIPPCKEA